MTKWDAVNRYYDFKVVLEDVGITPKNSNIKCPFHEDSKPSAHIYDNMMWCFTCHKLYKSSDIIKKHKLNINDYYAKLLLTMTEEDMENGLTDVVKEEMKMDRNKPFNQFAEEFFA